MLHCYVACCCDFSDSWAINVAEVGGYESVLSLHCRTQELRLFPTFKPGWWGWPHFCGFFLMIFVSIFIFLLRDVIWDVSVAYWQKFLLLMMCCFALCTQMVLWSSPTSSFNSQYSIRTWVGRYQNGKPCWILMWQEWRRWQCNSKMCRAPVRSSPSEYHHHLIFSGRILPVTQPAVLKHWRQIVILA